MIKTIIHPVVGEITLSRTRRATRLALSVRPDGSVRLSYPVFATQGQALNFLETRIDWIASTRTRLAEKYPPLSPPTEEEKAAIEKRTEELRREAKVRLPETVARLAAEHGFRYGEVRVKAARSKWGSCTVRNDINLSLFLVQLPGWLVEYVVLHELCHTVHKDHSARFHTLLDRVSGGHSKELNRELRNYRPDVRYIK